MNKVKLITIFISLCLGLILGVELYKNGYLGKRISEEKALKDMNNLRICEDELKQIKKDKDNE